MADDAQNKPDAPHQDGEGKDDKNEAGQEKDGGDKGGGGKDDDGKRGEKQPDKPRSWWPWLLAGAVVVVFVGVILFLVLVPHAVVKTDDAYVASHYAMVAPRVSGQVNSVRIDDNQPVRAGQLLATLDPRDYQTALAQAEATRQGDRARVAQADAQIARQPSVIRQAAAQVASARARLDLARADQRRFAALAATGAGTVQQHQQADATLREAEASLAQALAELTAQRRQLDSLRADRDAATAQVARDDAAVAQAELNLGYTRISAPIAGVVAQKTVQVGNQVAPGAALLILVPLQDIYITANFRELELRHMRPGQRASIHVDTYNVDLAGYVESLPPASGATFSPIPPNNATGNFTKIVQRLPVKIGVSANQPVARLLRAGMSVVVRVDTQLDDVVGAERARGGAPVVVARRPAR